MGCKRTQEDFIARATIKHNGTYDYSNVVYTNGREKITIICPQHGEFRQTADIHLLYGKGCFKCGREKAIKACKFTTDEFIQECKKRNNGEYNYSKTIYKKGNEKIIIICQKHGEFKQMACMHLYGQGCPKCAKEKTGNDSRLTTEEFKRKCNEKHNFFYDYSKSVYSIAKEKITIICPVHGEFKQMASAHLYGCGCIYCWQSVSKLETLWLDSLCVPSNFRQQKIVIGKKYFRTDAADIENKIVWEFYGDFWHGNINRFPSHETNKVVKKTFGELNAKTMNREKILKDNGYTIISIWESDFKSQKQLV